MSALLQACGVSKQYEAGAGLWGGRRVCALTGFSIEFDDERPSFVGLVGESGSGKTTACRLLLGFIHPTEGSVRYRERDLRSLDGETRMRFRREVQAVFQDPFETFNPFYRVNHCLAAAVRGFRLASSRREEAGLIEEALVATGLDPAEVLGRYPHELSGGQRQRVMVARALLVGPKLVIADEPVSMIDASLRASILAVCRSLYSRRGICFLYITHDLTTAGQVCESILVLYRGRTVEVGPADEVIGRPAHPYTQELIASIPDPEPGSGWLEGLREAPEEDDEETRCGCPYLTRCAQAERQCGRQVPPLFRTAGRSVAACWLCERFGKARDEEVRAAARACGKGGA